MVVALGNSTQISRNKRKNVIGEIENENQLVIKLPEGRILRVIARSVLLCVAILAFPWIGSLLRSPAELNYDMVTTWRQPINEFFFLPVLFQDLNHHDLLKSGDRALFLGGVQEARPLFLGGVQEARPLLESEGTEMDLTLISPSDEQKQGSVPDETFDFAYGVGFGAAGFIDRALKTNGVAAIRLTGDPAETFRVPTNFRIVYIRKFHNTIVAFRKIAPSGDPNPTRQSSRKLLDAAKKAALDGLEDPLLEPPRSRSKETQRQYQRIKYLPQLTGDSLDGYPRRVFISVGPNLNSDGWLERNYPSKNRDFEIYKVETVGDKGWAPPVGMSEWLERNVKEEEYVVMLAEAEVVEEMMKSRAINLVDELFLECKHEGQKGSRKMKSRRAYWECLALFGKLRDEGVAVHQWWG